MTATLILGALGSGILIGAILGLIGGGGSILAVPLLLYVVGMTNPHLAIGTGAVAVAVNALSGLLAHARNGTIKWRCATLFSLVGIIGAAFGSTLGKAMDGQKLLALFGLVMVGVGLMAARKPVRPDVPDVRLTMASAGQLAPRLALSGVGVGLASGFFGIGGGFLIVPGLMWATAMPMSVAVGTSLVGVAAFGATTTFNYALSGLVDWPIAGLLILGGFVGSALGTRLSARLGTQKRALSLVFAAIVVLVGCWIAYQGFSQI